MISHNCMSVNNISATLYVLTRVSAAIYLPAL